MGIMKMVPKFPLPYFIGMKKNDPVFGVILQGYFFILCYPQLGRLTKMILSFHFNLGRRLWRDEALAVEDTCTCERGYNLALIFVSLQWRTWFSFCGVRIYPVLFFFFFFLGVSANGEVSSLQSIRGKNTGFGGRTNFKYLFDDYFSESLNCT